MRFRTSLSRTAMFKGRGRLAWPHKCRRASLPMFPWCSPVDPKFASTRGSGLCAPALMAHLDTQHMSGIERRPHPKRERSGSTRSHLSFPDVLMPAINQLPSSRSASNAVRCMRPPRPYSDATISASSIPVIKMFTSSATNEQLYSVKRAWAKIAQADDGAVIHATMISLQTKW